MNMHALCLLLFQFLILPITAFALTDPTSSGQAGAFLRLGVGARAGSLGDAYVAIAGGPSAIYWNPAGIGRQQFWQFEASQRRFAMDRVFSFAGVTFPISSRAALGLGWLGFNSDGIEARRGNTSEPDGYFSDSENAFLLSASYRLLDWLAIGATTKAVKHNLFNESATGYSAGAGANLYLHERLTLAASFQDFYSTFKWKDGRWEPFPPTKMFGVSWLLGAHSLLTLDYHETENEPKRVRAGLELTNIASMPLRVGYGRNSFAAGAGLETSLGSHLLRFDYNFSSNDGINGHAHAFSIAMDFSRGERSNSFDSDFAASNKIKTQSTSSTNKEWKTGAQSINKTIRINTTQLNVRSGPGMDYKVIDKIDQGSTMQATRWWEDWYEIKLDKKKSGWVNKEFVQEL